MMSERKILLLHVIHVSIFDMQFGVFACEPIYFVPHRCHAASIPPLRYWHNSSKVSSTIIVHSKFGMELTFENLYQPAESAIVQSSLVTVALDHPSPPPPLPPLLVQIRHEYSWCCSVLQCVAVCCRRHPSPQPSLGRVVETCQTR